MSHDWQDWPTDKPPVTEFHKTCIAKDKCPRCRSGNLDTGFECTTCGYDAMWIVLYMQNGQPPH